MDPVYLVMCFIIAIVLFILFNKLRTMLVGSTGQPLPGPKHLPLFGNSFDIDLQNYHHSFAKFAERYGAILKVSIFRQDVILVNDTQLLKEMFAGSPHGEIFNDRPTNAYSRYITFGNKSLVFGPANQKTFTMRKLYLNGLNLSGADQEQSNFITEDVMKQFVHEITETKQKDFDINLTFRKSLGNLTSSFLTGKPPADQDWTLIFEFIDGVNFLASAGNAFVYEFMPFIRFVPGKFRDNFIGAKTARDKLLERFYYGVKDDLVRDDRTCGFAGALLKVVHDFNMNRDQDIISEDNVKSMVLDTVFAATETSSSALLNTFALFVEHTGVAKKIQAEIDTVIGTGRLPRLSDKNQMPYLMASIWEALRYASGTPVGVPHRVAKDYRFRDYFIPKYAILFANYWFIHHDPTIWNDPWKFRPERFLDSEGNLVPPDHQLMQNVLPFATGQRKCPGEPLGIARLFLYTACVLQSFDLLPASSGIPPDNDPRHYNTGVSVITVKDFMCRAIPRD